MAIDAAFGNGRSVNPALPAVEGRARRRAAAGRALARRPPPAGAARGRPCTRAELVWLVNELTTTGPTLQAGHFVTTGACVAPIPVLPGRQVEADFGWIGRIGAHFIQGDAA